MSEAVKVSIRYRAFNPRTEQEAAEMALNNGGRADAATDYFTADGDPDNQLPLLERLFEATNLQEGHLWQQIESYLPADRTHTSLSAGVIGGGDEIAVIARGTITRYRCEPRGWSIRRPGNHDWQPYQPAAAN